MDDLYIDGVVPAPSHQGGRRERAGWTRKVVDGLVNLHRHGGLAWLGDVSGDADQIVVDGAVNLAADIAQGAGRRRVDRLRPAAFVII